MPESSFTTVPRKLPAPPASPWRAVSLAVLSTLAIVGAFAVGRPVYLERAPIVRRLERHAYIDSVDVRAPWLRAPAELAIRTPQFLEDRESFAMDLVRTGKANVARARSLADVAVREAYRRRIPPALVLGVMLTENDELKSNARSRVGAVGLMQIYPRHWRSALAEKFGSNLRADSVNLKYGIYILGWVAGKADRSWRDALLRYNGCVHGKNTPDCHTYPDVVKRQVEAAAHSTCAGASFDRCVVEPLNRRGD